MAYKKFFDFNCTQIDSYNGFHRAQVNNTFFLTTIFHEQIQDIRKITTKKPSPGIDELVQQVIQAVSVFPHFLNMAKSVSNYKGKGTNNDFSS